MTGDACDSCRARIIWAITPSGKASPIDYVPVPNGNLLLVQPRALGGAVLAIVLSGRVLERARARNGALWIAHFATCPERADWRARQDAKNRAKAASS